MTELIIILTTLALYVRKCWFDVVIDDVTLYKKAREYKERGQRLHPYTFRGLVQRFYGGTTLPWMWADHFISLILTAVIGVLIYYAFGKNNVSFFGALFYITNPVSNQTTCWLNGRRYAVNVILVLLAWWLRPFGLLFWIPTPMFQANAMLTPFLYIATEHWWLLLTLPIFFLFGKGYFLKKFKSRRKPGFQGELKLITPRKAVVMVKTVGYYFWHSLIPLRICFYSPFLQTFGVNKEGNKEAYKLDDWFWFSLWTIGMLVLAFINFPSIRLYLFWWILFTIQWSNLYTITQTVADRYTSISLIGLMIIVATVLEPYPIAITILLTYYCIKTLDIMNMYKGVGSFHDYHMTRFPESIAASLFNSQNMVRAKQYITAYYIVLRSMSKNKEDMRLIFCMARILHLMGLDQEALEAVMVAKAKAPDEEFMEKDKLMESITKVEIAIRKGINNG